MNTSDTTSELQQAILYKLLKYGNDQAEDLKPDADMVSSEIMQLIAAQRQRWEVAARKDELKLMEQYFTESSGVPQFITSRIAALDDELGKEQ